MRSRQLAIRQLDQELKAWKAVSRYGTPKIGWIKTIRKALGMSAAQLARRLKVSRVRLVTLELAEQRDATTLRSLKEAANALDCELVYAFVPRTSLSTIIKQQALKKAQHYLAPIAHSMKLEDQALSAKETRAHLDELVESLLSGSARHLWDKDS